MPLGPDSAVFSPFEDGHSEPDQRELLTVAAIWFAAIMLRLFNLLEIRDRDPFFHQPSVDPAFYHDWAMQIVGGNWLGEGVFLQGPLYPYLLSLLYSLTGPNLFLPRFLNCIVGSFVCVLVWHVAREVFGRRTALVASGMTAVYGMLIFYEGSLLIANIALPLNLLVVGSTLRALRAPSTKSWFVVGALIGIAALARPNMLLYAPAAFVMLLAFVAEPQTWAQK
ncbi:MAG: 4-amino-4-deoxy-L-arabinose transferase-like glycosyltransferase, partial [Myxococcota bacterium]